MYCTVFLIKLTFLDSSTLHSTYFPVSGLLSKYDEHAAIMRSVKTPVLSTSLNSKSVYF